MSDIISRSALLNELIADYAYAAADIVKAAPAVDAVPVVHGRWISIVEKLWNIDFPVVTGCRCSVCNVIVDEEFNYCPNCGAKMDGE